MSLFFILCIFGVYCIFFSFSFSVKYIMAKSMNDVCTECVGLPACVNRKILKLAFHLASVFIKKTDRNFIYQYIFHFSYI